MLGINLPWKTFRYMFFISLITVSIAMTSMMDSIGAILATCGIFTVCS